MQANQVAKLVNELEGYNILVYTGFEYEYLVNNSTDENGYMNLLNKTDILIDGKFVMAKKSMLVPFRGSTNQRAIDVQESLDTDTVVLHDFVNKRSNVCIV